MYALTPYSVEQGDKGHTRGIHGFQRIRSPFGDIHVNRAVLDVYQVFVNIPRFVFLAEFRLGRVSPQQIAVQIPELLYGSAALSSQGPVCFSRSSPIFQSFIQRTEYRLELYIENE